MRPHHVPALCAVAFAALSACADPAPVAPVAPSLPTAASATDEAPLSVSRLYRPTELQFPRGGFDASARRVNDKGVAVGQSGYLYVGPSPYEPGTVQCRVAPAAAIWRQGQVFMLHDVLVQALQMDPCRSWSHATDVNNHGVVVGTVFDDNWDGYSRGFVWSEATGVLAIQEIGTTAMVAITNRGLGVGYNYAEGPKMGERVFGWTQTGGTFEIPGPPRPLFNWELAIDVNDGGVVLGCSDTQVARWDARSIAELTSWICDVHTAAAPGIPEEYFGGGINERGDAVFTATRTTSSTGGESRPFLWPKGAAAPVVAPWQVGGATDVSDRGRLVGWWLVGAARTMAAVTQRGGAPPVALRSTAGGVVSVALGVNRCGDVVGWTQVPGGERKAMLWQIAACDAGGG
jgi:uncharacterized membrane protein